MEVCGWFMFLDYAPCIVYFVFFMGLVALFRGIHNLHFVSFLSSVGFFSYSLSKLCISASRFGPWSCISLASIA